jgi:hypothetical protein
MNIKHERVNMVREKGDKKKRKSKQKGTLILLMCVM